MKFAGIIAEYDPFHNGHAWQLAQAKALGAQHVAVAMSCGLTQRGALPLLPESVRVRAALECGADLVFALPAPWACAGAEAFARAGVHLLAATGCDALVFGAETPDAALLLETAVTVISVPPMVTEMLPSFFPALGVIVTLSAAPSLISVPAALLVQSVRCCVRVYCVT